MTCILQSRFATVQGHHHQLLHPLIPDTKSLQMCTQIHVTALNMKREAPPDLERPLLYPNEHQLLVPLYPYSHRLNVDQSSKHVHNLEFDPFKVLLIRARRGHKLRDPPALPPLHWLSFCTLACWG